MKLLYKILSLEPVVFGKVLAATLTAPVTLSGWDDETKAVVNGVLLLWVGWGERLLTTPTVKAKASEEKAVAASYDKALADVASLQPPVPPLPAPGDLLPDPPVRQPEGGVAEFVPEWPTEPEAPANPS